MAHCTHTPRAGASTLRGSHSRPSTPLSFGRHSFLKRRLPFPEGRRRALAVPSVPQWDGLFTAEAYRTVQPYPERRGGTPNFSTERR